MAATVPDLAAPIAGYARRLHAAIGAVHHVASPLGAWLLLALAGPASSGENRATLTEVLGCDVEQAATAAADLLSRPHPLVAAAAAVWNRPGAVSADWLAGLPAAVQTGAVPDQADADGWARRYSFGLIKTFPVRLDPAVYLVLATALATRVSWDCPFEFAPASVLGPASPWAARLARVLRAPRRRGHAQFIAATEQAGDVAVQFAAARGGLLVASVAAAPGVPPADVLAAAYRLGCARAVGSPVGQRSLFDLPLGDGPLWSVREEMSNKGRGERCTAVLPAWSAHSRHDLTRPGLGFRAAREALAGPGSPWTAAQSAMARYSRVGFEAAAVTGMAVASAVLAPSRGLLRTADLRFGHPFAVVAVAVDSGDRQPAEAPHGPWHGLPVFSAWVTEPEDAADDGHPA